MIRLLFFCLVGCTFHLAAGDALIRGWPEGPTATVAPPAYADLGDRHPMYRRHDDLAETLVATRAAYRDWRVRQNAALPLVTWGAWRVGTGVAPERLAEISRTGADWPEQAKLVDDAIVAWKDVAPAGATGVMLLREIQAAQDAVLTIGLGGGTHLAVALNGRTLFAGVSSRIERFNTDAVAQDDPVLDRVLIDLPLHIGANWLAVVVRHDEPRRQVFASTRTVHPVQRLWDWLWHDFPGERHALMAAIPATWMGSDTMGPSRQRNDRQQMWARQYRTTTPELQQGRPYAEGFPFLSDKEMPPPPEADRKPGLLHDGWFDARDQAFERAFLADHQETLPADPTAWLAACQTAAHRRRLLDACASLAQAIAALAQHDTSYPAAELRRRAEAIATAAQAATRLDPATAEALGLAALQREALVARNPLLRGRTLAFVKRHTYASHHVYDDYNHGIRSFAGNLFTLDLATGRERELLPQLRGGVFDRFDVSRDGTRAVFAYRRPYTGGMRIHEAALDGSWVRQITHAPDDEAERIRRHSEFTPEELLKSPTLHGHWTDDVQPCYLPDGGVAFVSTRPEYSIYCGTHETMVTTMHRVERDGSGLERLSNGSLSELFPSVLDNGRLMYTRYEYVFKGNLCVHGLWSMQPDGRMSEEVYGNNIPVPPTHAYGRQVPGRSDLVFAIGCSHETRTGSVIRIDLRQDRRLPAAMTSFTPEISSYGISNLVFRNGRWLYRDLYGPSYQDPFPLDADFVLVAGNPSRRLTDPTAYGIWLIDRFGNRVLVHNDPAISCFQPMLLPTNRTPIPAVLARAKPTDATTGTLLLADAGRGLPGVDPGTIKHLRILEQVPRPWDGTNRLGGDYFPGSATALTMGTHIWVAVDCGIVPVEADGSAHFTVPADRCLFFQLLDADYQAIQTMRTWVQVRPGEVRSCIGCHDDRQAPPSAYGTPLAARRPPSIPQPQPGIASVPRPLHYPRDIQPILDRACISCHSGPGTKADLDLRATTDYLFTRSYTEFLERGLVAFIEEHKMAMWHDPRKVFVPFAGMEHAEATPPGTFGAKASRLTTILNDTTHRNLLTPTERIAFWTFLDTNAQFWGSYFGNRLERYKDRPGYRFDPDLATARGKPPFLMHPMPGAP